MSVNLTTLYAQQYSTNVQLLLQQMAHKMAGTVTVGSYSGTQASPVDQVGKVEMVDVTGRFEPKVRTDAPTDRRWVQPRDSDLTQQIDTFDKLRMISDPKSAYVQNAVAAANRVKDKRVIQAFTASAATGVSGGTSTIFTAANEVDVAEGGANSKLSVAKIKAVRQLMMANFVDFDMEEVYIGITAADHAALLNDVQVISSEFKNGEAPVLQSGRVTEFLGFKFVHCELIETLLAGTNEVTLPVWCKSGMHLGVWNDITTSVRQATELKGEPWEVYTYLTCGATRLEENKVYAIESYRA
jgi:hypothetical protein